MSIKAVPTRSAAKLSALAFAFLAAGCSVPKAKDAYTTAQPKIGATRSITSFSSALECMDGLFLKHHVPTEQITSVGIPDATGQVSTGTRDMLITAISRMTRRSNAFEYNDWELERQELNFLNDNDPTRQPTIPKYYIRGAITQLDQRVSDVRKGGGISIALEQFGGDVSFDKNETASVVGVDFNIGLVATRKILPGLTASNSLAFARKGEAYDAGLAIEQAGAFFSLEMERSEGMHTAVRTLVELGAIELLGKLSQVPYWDCLQIEGTNPKIMEEVVNWYNGMSDRERNLFVQRVLIGGGYMSGEATGTIDESTRAAISRYQAENDVVPDGRISFDLYRRMLGDDRPLAAGPPVEVVKAAQPDFQAAQIPLAGPVSISLQTVRGAKPTYSLNEALEATASTGDDAYVYCYYQDGEGHIARVFPNRFDPDPYVPEGRIVKIPTPNTPLQIVFDDPGSKEELLCVSSRREIGKHLPQMLKATDLEPLPVKSMDELISEFTKVDGRVSTARLPIVVSQN